MAPERSSISADPGTTREETVFRGFGSGGQDGIYVASGGTIRRVADTNTAIPGGTGKFTSFGGFLLNGDPVSSPSIDNGDIAFLGNGGPTQDGIFAEIGGVLTVIADRNTPIPGTAMNFGGFDKNEGVGANIRNGIIAFIGGRASNDSFGLYKYSSGTLLVIVDQSTYIADVDGMLNNFGGGQGYSFDDDGNVSFLGDGGGVLQGVFATMDGSTVVKVAQNSDEIDGYSISGMGSYGQALDDGAVAFNVGNYGGSGATVNYVAIPDYRWTSESGGNWDGAANWWIGRTPRDVVPTLIKPDIGVTITGPTGAVTLASLEIDASTGTTTLDLPSSSLISVSGATTIGPGGRITGQGTLHSAATITNNGEIDLGTSSLQLTGGYLTNNGLIRGNGQIGNRLSNQATGEVRAETGKRILFSYNSAGANNNFADAEINLLGGTVEFADAVLNTFGAFIGGHGTLVFNGGLNNTGNVAFTGDSDVLGDVTNIGFAKIIISGGATVTFYDDVNHNAVSSEIRTSAGSNAVFLGSVSGPGPFTGTGTNYFEGDLKPGSSPAAVSFGGNVHLGGSANLEIELAGTTAGTEFDTLDIAGIASLGGTLTVALLDNFMPSLGDSFEIVSAVGGISGTFGTEALPSLTGNLTWNVVYNANSVSLIVLLPGDYNGNGIVDAADYTVWRKNPGGVYTSDDYNTWRAHFGQTAGSGAGSSANAAVPEPTAFVLLILAAAGLFLRRGWAA